MATHHLAPLAEPRGAPSRYSRPPLPAYRHVPGLTPHPVSHPAGHSYGLEEPTPSVSCRELPGSWRQCEEFLYGVDLFNRAYLWEAHESWEMVWIGAGKTTVPALFVQGLVQTAAALLRLHLGTPAGAISLLAKAGGRFEPAEQLLAASGDSSYMGLAVESWRGSVEDYAREGAATFPFLRLGM